MSGEPEAGGGLPGGGGSPADALGAAVESLAAVAPTIPPDLAPEFEALMGQLSAFAAKLGGGAPGMEAGVGAEPPLPSPEAMPPMGGMI
ncbi:hypothetical protein [Glutamicibacter sp.]|uniref:hypothetical protein n=1 Tax=Glutamicibacter sp. TaxID=1931995 RepID=UPI002FDA4FAC